MLSSGSEKNKRMLSGVITDTRTRCGGLLSGFEAKTLLRYPGVPPEPESDACQFELPAQGLCGSIISSDQPPSFLFGSTYQLSVYETVCTSKPVLVRSVIVEPVLVND